jgi:hypothetical protein
LARVPYLSGSIQYYPPSQKFAAPNSRKGKTVEACFAPESGMGVPIRRAIATRRRDDAARDDRLTMLAMMVDRAAAAAAAAAAG